MEIPKKILRILIVDYTPERRKILKNLYRDHAWVLVHTATRAIRLLDSYRFDLISLDYNIAGIKTGEEIADFKSRSENARAKVIIHSMNPRGREKIAALLQNADIVPISKMVKNNKVFKKIRSQLLHGPDLDWSAVFDKS
ncbi:hypothetical protein JW935_18460 [candidate division KSB1 bacterium]|nr:hypothetical protein [candidate division KSB1 bacterium]